MQHKNLAHLLYPVFSTENCSSIGTLLFSKNYQSNGKIDLNTCPMIWRHAFTLIISILLPVPINLSFTCEKFVFHKHALGYAVQWSIKKKKSISA